MMKKTLVRLVVIGAGVSVAAATLATAAPVGALTEFGVGAGHVPFRIVSGADGAVWFTDQGTVKAIGRITTGGAFSYVPLPAGSFPRRGNEVEARSEEGDALDCDKGKWSRWAGDKPSRTRFGFDGYRWLRDGVAIAGETSRTYEPTAADDGHELSCSQTVTYAPFPTTVTATSASVGVRSDEHH